MQTDKEGVTGPVPFPDSLVENGRSVLAKFGYTHQETPYPREDYAEMWEVLKPDFPHRGPGDVPSYDGMSPAQQEAAREYMDQRLVADRRYELCSIGLQDLFEKGINTELVERYTTIRDAYEDSVEDFGAARERLQTLLAAE
ncbi:MAG: hypothetical protein QNJ94_03665 [Alphaproteobacteria bacterium]|nr:hypothetical protein [Alphaproteobacteria bacterium]